MKRGFDILVGALLLLLSLPTMIIVTLVILIRDGGPVFYVSERMKTTDHAFNLIKFRTMSSAQSRENTGVTGGDKTDRITPTGRILRRFRLDELPQLFNVLKGDMSLVGPRPPLRQYTDQFPQLYRDVLHSKPGVTGLATLLYHRHEERLIKNAQSSEETEAIYTTRCIPRKAALDLIYQRHASVCFDMSILARTIRKVFRH